MVLRLSPDGTRAAYLAQASKDPALDSRLEGFALFVDGPGGREQLSDAIFDAWFATPPAWRPDGTMLAVVCAPSDEFGVAETTLGVAAPGGHRLEPRFTITPGSICRSTPAWSPDGERIAIAENSNTGTSLCVLDPQGRLIVRHDIPSADYGNGQCSWSSDGKQLALVACQRLYLFELLDAAPRTVATISYPDSDAATPPIWIEQENALVFGAGKAAWRVEIASGKVTRLFGARPIVDVVQCAGSTLYLGLEESEVDPRGLGKVAKAVETLASAGHPRKHWLRLPVLLDPHTNRERELDSLASESTEITLTRDASLPVVVRQALASY